MHPHGRLDLLPHDLLGRQLASAQDAYFAHAAVVNLYAFRSAYNQVNSFVHQAKKSYDMRRREDTHRSGEVQL